MNRMDIVFSQMANKNEKILVSYFPIGDSYVADSVGWAKKFFDNGTTVLEIGLPYEEPILDGSTVAGSMERALQRTDLDAVLLDIANIRKAFPDSILQIMTYFENIEKYGVERFAKICAEVCDVDAVLSPNADKEQRCLLDRELGKYGIYDLRFIPYRFGEDEIRDLLENGHGYVYLQAVDGKTGSGSEITTQIRDNVEILRAAGITLPLIPGFGISTREHVKAYLDMGADGVIIGSALINKIIDGKVESYLKEIRAQLDAK